MSAAAVAAMAAPASACATGAATTAGGAALGTGARGANRLQALRSAASANGSAARALTRARGRLRLRQGAGTRGGETCERLDARIGVALYAATPRARGAEHGGADGARRNATVVLV